MGKRQEAALETRKKLIEAMKTLLITQNVDSINIEDITKSAGVAKGTFYVYFKRKEDICAEISFEKYDALLCDMEHLELPLAERISYFLRSSIQVCEESTLGITQQWFRAVVAPSKDYDVGMRKLNFDLDFMRDSIQRAIYSGELPESTDIELLSKMIVSEFYGAVILWSMSNGNITMQEILEGFCDHTLPKLLKP